MDSPKLRVRIDAAEEDPMAMFGEKKKKKKKTKVEVRRSQPDGFFYRSFQISVSLA